MTKKTKQTKRSDSDIKMEFLKDNLKNKKEVYETYVEVLAEYRMSELAYSLMKIKNRLNKELLTAINNCRGNDKSMLEFMFGKPGHTEIEMLEASIKYYDELINDICNRINSFPIKTKIKMAKEAVEKGHSYHKLCAENYAFIERNKKDAKRNPKQGKTSSRVIGKSKRKKA